MMTLTGRYYRTVPHDQPEYVFEDVQLDPKKTALVTMHCWNIGCEGGPPADKNFWTGMGFPQTLDEAARLMREKIRPAVEAARRAGVLVCHVETANIAARHPRAQQDADPPSGPPPPEVGERNTPPIAVPGWAEAIAVRAFGAHFENSPYFKMDRATILAPGPGEPFVYQSPQFARILHKHGIENLIYTGFATDMCVLRAAGGIEPMAAHGYRFFLMRDATLGVEMPDWWEERIATRWGIRFFETHYGDSVECDDFIRSCNQLAVLTPH